MMKRCTGCGLCAGVCPAFVFEMTDDKALVVRGDWCIGCGQCGAVCPEEAILHEASAVGKGPRLGSKPVVSAEKLMLLLRERRSVRSYRHKPVPKKVLGQILEAGRYAPTGSNSQNVHYMVLATPAQLDELRAMTISFYERIFKLIRNRVGAFLLRVFAGRRIVEQLQESIPKLEHVKALMDQGKDCLFYGAPAVMVVHAESWDTCSAFNGAVALYNCSLVAHTLGVGCCFNGYLQGAANNSRRIRQWLGIPRDHQCFGAMTLGYQKIRYQRLVERDSAKVAWR
jgi:nitroreductase/NAD-dependent dihydropyrimidine dehydrogenase PreA subunit